MSVRTDPVPPAPEHTPPLKEDEGTPKFGKYFNHAWTRWFISLREKINVISESLVNLGEVSGSGMLAKDGDGWFTRTIQGTTGKISVTDGDGALGDPTVNLVPTSVTPGSYTNTNLTVDEDGRITAASDGGGGVGGNIVVVAQGRGTPYTLTDTSSALTFGIESPLITLPTAGYWLLESFVQLNLVSGTVTNQLSELKLRRTNNTPADIVPTISSIDLPVSTTLSHTLGVYNLPTVRYESLLDGDTLSIFGSLSAPLDAGDVDAVSASFVATFIEALPPYVYLVFTVDDFFIPPAGVTSVDALIVAGGGGGMFGPSTNTLQGGGGGAGGVLELFNYAVTPLVPISVVVGAGGIGGIGATSTAPASGEDSSFDGQIAVGGGVGGRNNTTFPAGSGGSGGGNNNGSPAGTGTPGQGNAGATGSSNTNGFRGGGGGGYATAGVLGGNQTGGTGGAGYDLTSTIWTDAFSLGLPPIIAGGGGGACYSGSSSNLTGGAGGIGGGGAGGGIISAVPQNGGDGMPLTGGGAGSGATSGTFGIATNGGTGGSGIVVVRYAIP